LLPDYTRKSQTLAEIEKNKGQEAQKQELAPYEREDWEPKNYAELAKAIKTAEDRGHTRALSELQRMDAERNDVKQQVDDFIDEARRSDPDFDEDDFYRYANRLGFPLKTVEDLKPVFSAYQETNLAKAKGIQKGRTGKESRTDDKVNAPRGGTPQGPDFSDIRSGRGGIREKAAMAFERLNTKQ
jgi:hypothetical protein